MPGEIIVDIRRKGINNGKGLISAVRSGRSEIVKERER